MRPTKLSLPFAVLAALCAGEAAAAFCLPEIAYYRYVGDKASDANCTDDTIQSAIDNLVCPNTTIVITSEHTYTAQHLDIDGKDLTLQGTALNCGPPGACGDACPPPPTGPLITVSGSGHSGDSVLYIHGNSHVTIRYLQISDGSNLNGPNATYGGGIHFDGSGALTIDTSTITNNAAMYGGGIQFTGSGGFAGLALLAHSLIVNNSAGASGGGIRVDGDAYMTAFYDGTTIWYNHAPNGYGGGLNIVGPAHADLASPGYAGLGVVDSNDAKYGGGIAATGAQGEDVQFGLFTLDPQRPVRVSGNFASDSGGAIYLKPYIGGGDGFASLCARDFRIDDNAAPEGSAIFAGKDSSLLDGDLGSFVELNVDACSPNAVPCAAGVACNTLDGNHAEDDAATPTEGAAIYVDGDSTLDGQRFAMRGTEGGYAIRMLGDPLGPQTLANCLLADNAVTQQLLRNEGDETIIRSCTLAGNTIGSTDVIHAEGPFTLSDSIIQQPGNVSLAYSGDFADRHVGYVLASEVNSLFSGGEGVVQGAAQFVDAAHGDYHLANGSPGVDFAPHVQGNTIDLDGMARERDLPAVPNQYGLLDLGAYERQPTCAAADTLFCSGFEE